ncbi:MAG: PIN domain nuclease [Bacteroidales bacterium]
MILVDSSVWIDYFNGVDNHQANYLYDNLGSEVFVTGDLIMLEVLQGFGSDKDFETGRIIMESLPFFNLCGKEVAIAASKNYRILRKKGITLIKTIDMVIATFCIENKIRLLHNDKDFMPLQELAGLEVVGI